MRNKEEIIAYANGFKLRKEFCGRWIPEDKIIPFYNYVIDDVYVDLRIKEKEGSTIQMLFDGEWTDIKMKNTSPSEVEDMQFRVKPLDLELYNRLCQRIDENVEHALWRIEAMSVGFKNLTNGYK